MSDAAVRLLKAAASSPNGLVLVRDFLGGSSISAGNEDMFDEKADAREVAKWRSAVEDLEAYGLIEATSYKRTVFRVTHAGYEAASKLD